MTCIVEFFLFQFCNLLANMENKGMPHIIPKWRGPTIMSGHWCLHKREFVLKLFHDYYARGLDHKLSTLS